MADEKADAAVEVNSIDVYTEKKKKKKKKKTRSNTLNFNKFIYQILKQVHPKIAISSASVELINTYTIKLMMILIQETWEVPNLQLDNSQLQTADRELIATVRVLFPPQLAELAVSAICKAKHTYRVSYLADLLDRNMSLK
ncbi:uncharacterized protein [Cicer arietinum]|uniref:Histone H2B type 1-A-like n=1 Tax=Cicer arietinum TaxID=3827 RepID=A0A1S2YNT0_CICAR|nr:histone H2B type 1-A-like [Cicer arietinum]